jgi:hypothetical protein
MSRREVKSPRRPTPLSSEMLRTAQPAPARDTSQGISFSCPLAAGCRKWRRPSFSFYVLHSVRPGAPAPNLNSAHPYECDGSAICPRARPPDDPRPCAFASRWKGPTYPRPLRPFLSCAEAVSPKGWGQIISASSPTAAIPTIRNATAATS